MNGRVNLATVDTEKAEVLIEIFAPVTTKTAPRSLPIGDWEGC